MGFENIKKRTPKIDTTLMLPPICILMIWEPLPRFLKPYAVPSLPFILAKIYIFKIQEFPFSIPRNDMQSHYLVRRLVVSRFRNLGCLRFLNQICSKSSPHMDLLQGPPASMPNRARVEIFCQIPKSRSAATRYTLHPSLISSLDLI